MVSPQDHLYYKENIRSCQVLSRTVVLDNLDELERTPEEVAVSQGAGGQGGNTLLPVQTNLLEVVGGVVANWRPQFIARHRKYADHSAVWGESPWLLPEIKDIGKPDPEIVLASKKSYKDILAKRSFGDADLDFLLTTKCPGYWIMGHDDIGSRYAKELYCGREWCSVCGKKNSPMHLRRFARLLPKTRQMEGIGYFVIEWPIASRDKLRTKKALSDAGILIRKTLKGLGFERGLSRWHWMGEKSNKYNPHLNIVFDGRHIPKLQLEAIKAKLRRVTGEASLIVNYSYRKSPGEMVHTLKYITRPTFLDWHWDAEMAMELRGFRNQSWWGAGKWNGELLWSLDDLEGEAKKEVEGMDTKAVEALEQGISPKTGGKIHWGKPIPINILHGGEIEIELDTCKVRLKMPGLKKRSLGAGYYELEPVQPPGKAPPEKIDMEV